MITLVVSIKPIKLLMQAFLGDSAQVYQLIPDGLTPHDFQLKLSDLQKIKNANLMIWLGEDAEPYLEKILRQQSIAQIDVLSLEELIQYPYRDLNQWLGKEESVSHHAGHSAHTDIHFWLSLTNNRVMIDAVARYLYERNLLPAAVIEKKRQQMGVQLTLIESLLPASGNRQDRRVLVYHDAFQYLEKDLDLQSVGAVVADPEASVGLKRLFRLQKIVETEKIECVLITPAANRRILQKLFVNGGYRMAVIDPLAADPALDTFERFWVNMIEEVKRCVS